MSDSSGHLEDMQVEGVFTKEKDAEQFLASLWRDYIADDLDEDQEKELDEILDAKNFDIDKVHDFSNGIDSTQGAPLFDQMEEEFSIVESNII